MWLHVDTKSHTPMYQQIIDGIKEQIVRGILKPGERLMTVRELAASLSLNHNTVAKAYQELERDRIIELIRGRGTFVATQSVVPDLSERKLELRESMKRWLVEAHHLRMADDEIQTMFDELFRELRNDAGGEHATRNTQGVVKP